MGKKKSRRVSGSSSISAWGTKFNRTFESKVFTTPLSGTTSEGNLSTVREAMDKQKPSSGNARKHPDGWRPPTPFRSYACRLVPGPAFDYNAYNSAGAEVRHTGPYGYQPGGQGQMTIYFGTKGVGNFPRTSDNLVNRSTTECLNKLANMDVNVSESIATLGQTIGMVANIAAQMLSIYRSIRAKQIAKQKRWDHIRELYYSMPMRKRKRIRQSVFMKSWGMPAKRPVTNPLSKSAGSAWLELHYGWKPLCQDISFAMNAFRNGLPKQKVTAIRNVSEQHDLPVKIGSAAPYSLNVSGYCTSGCKVRVDASLSHPNVAALNSLGLINPFQLGWELLPFSFVLDWLLPIGNALSALTTPFGLTLKGISTTRYTKMSVRYVWCQYPGYTKGTKISASTESMATYRTVSFFWPTPRTYFKSPFNLTRAVTALALLQQLR